MDEIKSNQNGNNEDILSETDAELKKFRNNYLLKHEQQFKRKSEFLKKTKKKYNSHLVQNEILSKEMQKLSRKSIAGNFEATIHLFINCLVGIKKYSNNPDLVNEIWSFIPELIKIYEDYQFAKSISYQARRKRFILLFSKTQEKLYRNFADNLIEIKQFIIEVLSGTIIYTRKISGSGFLSKTIASDILDGTSSDEEEEYV